MAAIKQLIAKQAQVRARGIEVTPEHIDEFLRAKTAGRFGYSDYKELTDLRPDNVIRSAMNGGSFNWGDDLIGLFSKQAGEESRLRSEVFRQAHPAADLAAQFAGALATGHGFSKAIPIAGAATVRGTIARGAAAGATAGALGGAGEGDGAPDKAMKAAQGGVLGAISGGLVSGLAGGAKALYDPASRAARRLSNAIDQSGGADQLQRTLDDITRAGRGDVVTLADLSPQLNQAADFSANNAEPALITAGKILKARQANQATRLLEDVRTTLGDSPYADRRGIELKAAKKAFADGPTGYGGLRDANPTYDLSAISAALNKPSVQSAWKQARLAGDLVEENPIDKMLTKLAAENPGVSVDALRPVAAQISSAAAQDAGTPLASRPPSFDDMQQLVRTLKSKSTAAWRRGDGALGDAYKTIAGEVGGALEAGSPGFQSVNGQYAQHNALQRALTAGEDAWQTDDSRGLAAHIGTLSDPELEQFRYGLASKLVGELRGASTNRDAARRLLDRSAALDDKLQTVFGTRDLFNDFMGRVSAEGQLSGLKTVVGGSQTARRLAAAGFDPAEMGVAAIAHPAGFGARVAANIANATTGAMSRNTANAMAGPLFTQGAPDISALLRTLNAPKPLISPFFGQTLPAGLPSLFSSSLAPTFSLPDR
jgi:hypothetical protein